MCLREFPVSDLRTQLVAAVQQVRTSTPRECERYAYCDDGPSLSGRWHAQACNEQWAERVDARLAVCVEAMLDVAVPDLPEDCTASPTQHAIDQYERIARNEVRLAGLAAFLAAAAQEDK